MTKLTAAQTRLFGVSALALAATSVAGSAYAQSAPTTATEKAKAADKASDIAEGSDIVVTATRANESAPVTASLQTTEPQAIVSRSFIEDSLPATVDFNQIALITPSVTNFGGNNGIGLSESKAQIRGFQDGEYNVPYDGVPFGGTNDPTHHSTTFFPSNTIETLVVDRGPGMRATSVRPLRRHVELVQPRDARRFRRASRRQLWQLQCLSRARLAADRHLGKVIVPVGPDVTLTFIGTYNKNRFNHIEEFVELELRPIEG